MSSDPKVVNFADARDQRRGLLDEGSAEPFASATEASTAPAVTMLSNGETSPRYRRVFVASDVKEASLDHQEFWFGVKQRIGMLPGDTVVVYADRIGEGQPSYLGARVCETITAAGPVMGPYTKRLQAEIIPAEPIDAVMAFLKSAHSPLSVADLAVMAGLTSRKERLIVKSIEALGWEESWPPEFSKLERNRRIIEMAKDICIAAGVSTNEAPGETAVNRFYRAIAKVAPRRRTDTK